MLEHLDLIEYVIVDLLQGKGGPHKKPRIIK
jgi:hypothetical protein